MNLIQKFSATYLHQILDYNPTTGKLVWNRQPCINNWNVRIADKEAGNITKNGYRSIGIDGHQIQSHVVIWKMTFGENPEDQIDHINRDRADNRLCNLRIASSSQNNMNSTRRRSDNTSGYAGVNFNRSRNKWYAVLWENNNYRYLGCFSDKDEAIAAKKTAEALYFKEFSPQ